MVRGCALAAAIEAEGLKRLVFGGDQPQVDGSGLLPGRYHRAVVQVVRGAPSQACPLSACQAAPLSPSLYSPGRGRWAVLPSSLDAELGRLALKALEYADATPTLLTLK